MPRTTSTSWLPCKEKRWQRQLYRKTRKPTKTGTKKANGHAKTLKTNRGFSKQHGGLREIHPIHKIKGLIQFLYNTGVDIINTNELEYVYLSELWTASVTKRLFDKNKLHVLGRTLHPKDYLDEMYAYAWSLSMKNIPSILLKVIRIKNDKMTPVISTAKWMLKHPKELLYNAHDGYGYGKRGEVNDNIN